MSRLDNHVSKVIDMTVSPIGCTPIRPQVSFNGDNHKDMFKEFRDYSQILSKYKIDLQDIKEPLEIAETVLLAAIIPYASAKCLSYEVLSAKPARNCCYSIEKKLKSLANKVKSKAIEMKETKSKGVFPFFKKYFGLAACKFEKLGRKFYKTIAYYGLPENIDAKEKSLKAASNIIGAAVVAKFLPIICTKDSDNDGVIDIKQHKHSLISLIGPSI